MWKSTRIEAIYLAMSILLTATLACNISTPQGPVEPTPEVVTIIATAGEPQPVEAPTEISNAESAEAAATPSSTSADGGNSEGTDNTETGGDEYSTTSEGDILASVSIKNGNASFEGQISYPGDNTSDEIYVKPIDFDSEKTSGNLIFTLDCSGRGKAKVNYKGGAVKSGSPACGETWTIAVINGSPDSHIVIRLDASGDVNWSLTVTSSE